MLETVKTVSITGVRHQRKWEWPVVSTKDYSAS